MTKSLAELGHTITMIAFSKELKGEWAELERYCTLHIVQHNNENSPMKALGNLFSPTPYTVSKYHSRRMTEAILRVLSTGKFDIVHIDTVHCAYYGPLIKQEYNIPVVLRVHDYLTAMMERFSHQTRNPFVKLYGKLQVRKLRAYEGPICAKLDKCLMVSKDDEDKLKAMFAPVRSAVIPPAVDTDYFAPVSTPVRPFSILWFGALGWQPNVDSLEWFIREIFPMILAQCPQAKLYVAGSGTIHKRNFTFPPRSEFIGFVEDIRQIIGTCEVAVVPLRIGSGVRLKILELFSMGKAVVATRLGAEGTGAIHEKHLLLADSADSFSGSVIRLFCDPDLKQRLSVAARSFAVDTFSCNKVVAQIEREYMEVLDSQRNLREQSFINPASRSR